MDKTASSYGFSRLDEPYHNVMNSERGVAFQALAQALDGIDNDDARARKWRLLEWASRDPSAALRAGAVEQLLFMLSGWEEPMVDLF